MQNLSHFGLRERPFEVVTDPRFYFASLEHREALARLTYLVDQQTMYFGMLTGDIGCGKSLTRKVFTAQIDPARHCVVEFENSAFDTRELLRQLFARTGSMAELPPGIGQGQLFGYVASLVNELHRVQQRQLVLVLDEAQDLPRETMLDLKRLSNLNGEVDGALTMILIGQPELRRLVENLPPLDQRISLRFHLLNLAAEEVGAYVEHRLRVAGHPTGRLFAPECHALLFQASRGVPREINRLAKLSLDSGLARGAGSILPTDVESVVHDLRRHQSMPHLLPGLV